MTRRSTWPQSPHADPLTPASSPGPSPFERRRTPRNGVLAGTDHPSRVTYQALATSGATSYGISTTGDVYAWGGGRYGQIGDGTTNSSLIPVKVASGAAGISATADDVLISVP